jgi:hypothetical protein
MRRQEWWRTCAAVLEVTTNIAVIGLLIIVVGTYVHARMTRPDQPVVSSAETTPPYQPSDVLSETLDDVRIAAKPATLLVVVQSRCKFCTASMPFYERMTKSAHADTQIVVLTQEEAAIGRAYVTSHGFEPDDVVSIPDFNRIHSTPTLILTDATRTVRRIWTGKLSADREAEVLAALAGSRLENKKP